MVPDVLDVIYEDVVSGLYFPVLNTSFNRRIKLAKFNLACDFLINSQLFEDEIILKLDFSTVEEFRILFKKYLGISPLNFRDRFSK